MHILTHAELQTVLEKTRQGLLEIFGDRLEHVWLYGSYARGEAHPESDIDIFALADVGANDIATYHRSVSNFSADIDLEYDVVLSIVTRDSKTVKATMNQNPFFFDVLTDGIDLLNADIEKVLAGIPVTVSFKMDAQIYEQAKNLFASLGFTMEETCNLFIEKSLACGGFPFSCTEKDIRDAQAIMEASERILKKHREAYVALADGFTDDFMESGREQGIPQDREEL